jgi:site-specific DNA-adenine methylase
MQDKLKAPFPWFGGKSRVAAEVWQRFGAVQNYVEPFAGSLAVLLGRPGTPKIETVNDLDYYIANFWRAVQADPEAVAYWADYPVNECDLHARHVWLVQQQPTLKPLLYNDPHAYDARVAGYWVWGICQWIGSGWCSDRTEAEAVPNKRQRMGFSGAGVHKQDTKVWKRHRMGSVGGVNAVGERRPKVAQPGGSGAVGSHGISEQLPHLADAASGVHTKRPNLGGDSGASGKGVHSLGIQTNGLYGWMLALAERLRYVRVVCGDWQRVCTPAVTTGVGLTGVFLDPPYGDDKRVDIYGQESFTVAQEVLAWCQANGDNPQLRIALCGYEGEHDVLSAQGWQVMAWKSQGGYANKGKGDTQGKANRSRERIWFSPGCLIPQPSLF